MGGISSTQDEILVKKDVMSVITVLLQVSVGAEDVLIGVVEDEEVDAQDRHFWLCPGRLPHPVIDGARAYQHHQSAEKLHGYEPGLTTPDAFDVEGVDHGCPEELERERPGAEREECLLLIADLLGQDQWDGSMQTHGNALERVEDTEKKKRIEVARVPGLLAVGAHVVPTRQLFLGLLVTESYLASAPQVQAHL